MLDFLKTHSVPKFPGNEVNDLKNPPTVKEIQLIAWTLPKKKSAGLDGFTGKFYYIRKEEITPIAHSVFQKREQEGTLSNAFYEANVILILKSERQFNTEKSEHQHKNNQQNTGNSNMTMNKKYTTNKSHLF